MRERPPRRAGLGACCILVIGLMPGHAVAKPAKPAGPKISCAHETAPTNGLHPTPVCIAARHFDRDLCTAIDRLADRHGLPPGFFARLIWQESRFDPNAVSPKGAEGIAQFVPSTARLRGLADSFNPADALARSAAYLQDLRQTFGNLGLAAVGYNAGEARAAALLDSGAPVPAETARYVFDITGLPVGAWTDAKPKQVNFRLSDNKSFLAACLDLARRRTLSPMLGPTANWKPWGAEVGASFSPAQAQLIFRQVKSQYPKLLDGERPMLVRQRNLSFGTRARYTVRIGRDTRQAAQQLCRSISQAGGFCVVRKN